MRCAILPLIAPLSFGHLETGAARLVAERESRARLTERVGQILRFA